MNIRFYNKWHNGDITVSRNFVRDIIDKCKPEQVEYVHPNSSMLLKDLKLVHVEELTTKYPDRGVMKHEDDWTIINTWYASYSPNYNKYQCTLKCLYENFKMIYEVLEIKLEPLDFYIPSFDYTHFKIYDIDEFFKTENRRCIYISNCKSMSNDYVVDWEYTLYETCKRNPESLIIHTNSISNEFTNSIYINTIINNELENNLVECGYVSLFCDVLIGGDSGPYMNTYQKENIHKDRLHVGHNEFFKKEEL